MTEREPLAHEAVRESQDPCRDTDHVIGDPENVAHVPEQFDVSMLDPDFPGDPVDNVETFDNDHDEHTPAEPVLHSSSSMSTKCLQQNLMILCPHEDGLLHRDFRQLLRRKNSIETNETGTRARMVSIDLRGIV